MAAAVAATQSQSASPASTSSDRSSWTWSWPRSACHTCCHCRFRCCRHCCCCCCCWCCLNHGRICSCLVGRRPERRASSVCATRECRQSAHPRQQTRVACDSMATMKMRTKMATKMSTRRMTTSRVGRMRQLLDPSAVCCGHYHCHNYCRCFAQIGGAISTTRTTATRQRTSKTERTRIGRKTTESHSTSDPRDHPPMPMPVAAPPALMTTTTLTTTTTTTSANPKHSRAQPSCSSRYCRQCSPWPACDARRPPSHARCVRSTVTRKTISVTVTMMKMKMMMSKRKRKRTTTTNYAAAADGDNRRR